MLKNQKLLQCSSGLFMVQSFTWCLFSFLCILCIENSIELNEYPENYNSYLLNIVYLLFFTKDQDHSDSKMVVTPNVFEAFAFVHFFLAIPWFILSATVLIKSSNKRADSLQRSAILKSWLVNGYLVALADGIFTVLLMVDMVEYNRLFLSETLIAMPALGLVFAIVSRGFTLWILNVIIIVKLSRDMWTSPRLFQRNEFETRYGNQYDGNAYVNNGYQPTSSMANQQNQYVYPPTARQSVGARTAPAHQEFEPYNRQANAGHAMNPSGYPTAAPISPYAQINRNPAPGRQSPPRLHAVSPPQIPEPDYQMGPRTVLKNRSQYDDRY